MSSTKGKTLQFNDKSMDYVTFGKGKKPAHHSKVQGMVGDYQGNGANASALAYREASQQPPGLCFSRITELPENYTTRDMATDIAETMMFQV